jgi:dihydrofolate synthase/folylpolyglutamate synthase
MFQRIGAAAYKADLKVTLALCEALGNPQLRFPSVHVAGTNGKGSVSHITASVLMKAGYRTGLFTSPHLRDYRERMRINGAMIPESYVAAFVGRHQKLFEELKPSFFEMTYAMAACWFAGQNIDVAVMETGMGGRLDSTNTCRPVLTVITNISPDHMQFLGNTLAAIAAEKAGIIRPGVPVVVGQTQPETDGVFTSRCKSLQSPCFHADQLFDIVATRYDQQSNMLNIAVSDVIPRLSENAKHLSLEVVNPESLRSRDEDRTEPPNASYFRKIKLIRYSRNQEVELWSPLPGAYQTHNIVTALAVAQQLPEAGFAVTLQNFSDGLTDVVKTTGIRGRWEKIGDAPLTIADTGHNEDGIGQVLQQLKLMQYKELRFVLGMVADKDVSHILAMLPTSAFYYFCKANIPRAMEAADLAQLAGSRGLKGEVFNTVAEALHQARIDADPSDLVLVGGSTFVVAEVV